MCSHSFSTGSWIPLLFNIGRGYIGFPKGGQTHVQSHTTVDYGRTLPSKTWVDVPGQCAQAYGGGAPSKAGAPSKGGGV